MTLDVYENHDIVIEEPIMDTLLDNQGFLNLKVHLTFFSFYTEKTHERTVMRVLKSLPSTMKLLNGFDFSTVLVGVDAKELINEEAGFRIVGTVLSDAVLCKNEHVVSDSTAYVQLLALISQKDLISSNPDIVFTNASYLLGILEVYQPPVCSVLRATILHHVFMIFEQLGKARYLRNFLFNHLRQAQRINNPFYNAVIGNLLLRNFVIHKDLIQASSFLRSFKFPQNYFGFQYSRYQFYAGLINASQACYNEALGNFKEALKTTSFKGAMGFKILVNKYIIILKILLIEKLEKSDFYSTHFIKLKPYLLLHKAASFGELQIFDETFKAFKHDYMKDGIFELATRCEECIRIFAVKTMLNSYCLISVDDATQKLGFEDNHCTIYKIGEYVRRCNVKTIEIDIGNNLIYNRDSEATYGTQLAFKQLRENLDQSINMLNSCSEKMIYDSKEYYNRLTHMNFVEHFFEEIDDMDLDPSSRGQFFTKNDDNDDEPETGM